MNFHRPGSPCWAPPSVAIIFTAALLTGSGITAAHAQAPASPLPSISAAPASTGVRAHIRARQHATLSAEMAGKIITLPFRDGDSFRKGDRLVEFDCSAQRARQDQAAAASTAATRKREVAGKLDQLNSISMLEVATADSAEAQAKAELALTAVLIQRCTILAPYDGRVSGVEAQRYAYAAEGSPLISIYDTSQFDVEMIVPSAWLSWLKAGLAFSLRVEETGSDHAAEVTRVSGQVDPVSQSVRVYGRVKAGAERLLPGMSGSVLLTPPGGVAPAP